MEIHIAIVEPDLERREWLYARLSQEAGFRVIGSGGSLLAAWLANSPACPVDVLLVDIEQVVLTETQTWAAIHVLLPGVRIMALAEGKDERLLSVALGAGVMALQRPNAEPAALCQAIRHAAQGLADYDPWLVELAARALIQPFPERFPLPDHLAIDLKLQEVKLQGRRIHLTPLEFKVLAYLACAPGRVISPCELLSAVWGAGPDHGGTMAQVYNCIGRIRRKIEPDAKHPQYLRSLKGWGYFLPAPLGGHEFVEKLIDN